MMRRLRPADMAILLALVCICALIADFALCVHALCSASFEYSAITVVDSQHQPVIDADITVTNRRTGKRYAIDDHSLSQWRAGTYLVFDDRYRDAIARLGERVLVTVRDGDRSATHEYVFGTDVCRCHIEKKSGPDVIVLPD